MLHFACCWLPLQLAGVADDARHLRRKVRRPLAPFQPLAALHPQEPGHAYTPAHVLAQPEVQKGGTMTCNRQSRQECCNRTLDNTDAA